MDRFGDPRVELLRQAQQESAGRIPIVDPVFAAAGAEGERQRAELRNKPRPVEGRAKRIADANHIKLSQDAASRPGIDDAAESIFGKKEKPE